MKRKAILTFLSLLVLSSSFFCMAVAWPMQQKLKILSYIIDPAERELAFYWKDEQGDHYANFKNLKRTLDHSDKALLFAMNGGMYNKDLSPQGLFIEKGVVHSKLDTKEAGYGNFYMQPNGVFYLTKDHKAQICTTKAFKNNGDIQYATQSGPMLLIDGRIHPQFKRASNSLHIRNGVGILPDGRLLFAMSKEKINFFDFSTYFLEQGCRNALYLDGFVSKTYLPAQHWEQLEGNFGVIIAETKTQR